MPEKYLVTVTLIIDKPCSFGKLTCGILTSLLRNPSAVFRFDTWGHMGEARKISRKIKKLGMSCYCNMKESIIIILSSSSSSKKDLIVISTYVQCA